MKVLNPTSGFPAWGSDKGTGDPHGIWPWRPAGFDYRTCTGLGETETAVLEGTSRILHAPRHRGKEQWPQLHASVGGSSVEAGVSRGSPQGWGHQQHQARKGTLGINPLGVLPTMEPVKRAGLPQAKQLPGREWNPTHQQILGWQLRARACPPEQDPVFPTTSPSQQEAHTSLSHHHRQLHFFPCDENF